MSETLKEMICTLPVIDTHEHLPAEAERIGGKTDLFDLFYPYICDNLLTAGMPASEIRLLIDKSLPFDARYRMFQPNYAPIRFTTYCRALEGALGDLFGVRGLGPEAAHEVNRKLSALEKPGFYKEMFSSMNIEKVMNFIGPEPDDCQSMIRDGFFAVPQVSDLFLKSGADVIRLERISGSEIRRFDDLPRAVDALFEKYRLLGVKALKFGAAYRRKLDYGTVSRSHAEKVFNNILKEGRYDGLRSYETYPAALYETQANLLEDYLTEYMLSQAGKLGFYAFFHTGIHAWNNNHIHAAHASYLESAVRRHPDVRFILLHCGMPFINDAVLLCKYYANVYLNLTWCHIIDREQTRLLIRKIIELLPLNKIHGFGGDYCHPVQIRGHLRFARENLTLALGDCVKGGVMSEPEALEIARMWLYDNPLRLLAL